jgi:hypothetical protein
MLESDKKKGRFLLKRDWEEVVKEEKCGEVSH